MTWLAWDFALQQHRRRNFVSSLILSQSHLAHRQHLVVAIQRARVLGLAESSSEIYFPHNGNVNCMELEKIDERFLICGTTDNMVVVYDTNKEIAPGVDHRKKIIALRSGFLVNEAQGGMVSSVDWYPSDCGIFIASSVHGVVKLYDTSSLTSVLSFTFPGRRVYDAKFRPIATQSYRCLIAAVIEGGMISLCDVKTGDNAHTVHGHTSDVTCVDWSPTNEHHLVTCSRDGTAKVWDIRRSGNSVPLVVLDWSRDHGFAEKVALNGALPRPILQNIKKEFSKAKAHECEILGVKFTPCGQYIVTSAKDASLRVWRACTAQLLPQTFQTSINKKVPYRLEIASFGHPSDDLLILPGGKSSASIGAIDIIPLFSGVGKPINSLKGHWDQVESLTYGHQTQRLISSSRDGMILEWKYSNERMRLNMDQNYRTANSMTPSKSISICERQTGLWMDCNLEPQLQLLKSYPENYQTTDAIYHARNKPKKDLKRPMVIKDPTPLKQIIPSILLPLMVKPEPTVQKITNVGSNEGKMVENDRNTKKPKTTK